MLVTHSKKVYRQAKAIRHAGLKPRPDGVYEAQEVGGKLLMTEFQAAVLVPQLRRLDEIVGLRQRTATILRRFVAQYFPYSTLQSVPEGVTSVWQRVAFCTPDEPSADALLSGRYHLERFYPSALADEPVIRASAKSAENAAEQSRDLYGRMVGWTLNPFDDMSWAESLCGGL